MNDLNGKSTITLPERLDVIWRTSGSRFDSAVTELKKLKAADSLILGAWAVGAAVSPTASSLSFSFPDTASISDAGNRVLLHLHLLNPTEKANVGDAIMINEDNTVAIMPTVANLVEREEFDSVALLTALELIRDHIDSTLFLPLEARVERWRILAEKAKIKPDFFAKLAGWYPQIEQFTRSH